mgnify:CR=1 FL=1
MCRFPDCGWQYAMIRKYRWIFFVWLVFGVSLFQTGCNRSGEESPVIKIEHHITPDPPAVGAAQITLKLTDEIGQPIRGARVRIEGNMSHAGMRPVFSETTELESGRYEAPLQFTMAGDWIILIDLALPNGQKLQKQIAINGVRSG